MSLPQPSLQDLTPYLGLLLVKATPGETDEEFAKRLLAHASSLVAKGEAAAPPNLKLQTTFGVQRSVADRPWIGGLVYEKSGRPTWWQAAPEEWTRYLVLVAAKGRFGAVCASDTGFRDRFGLPNFTPVDRAEMSQAFIGSQASTAWFAGIHSPTEVKPDAKMLSGQALEFAIDPLGDQTYYLSAVRSHPAIAGLSVPPATASPSSRSTPQRRKRSFVSVGVAPGRSRIWLGAAKDWSQFEDRLNAVLDHVASAKDQTPAEFGKLAQEVVSGVVFGNAYAMALTPPELLDEDIVVDEEMQRLARRLVDDLEIDLTPGPAGTFGAETFIDNGRLATLSFAVVDEGGILKPSLTVVPVPAKATNAMTDRDEAASLSKALKRLARGGDFKVYFDKPVTVIGSQIFKSTFEDRPFAWAPRSFAGTDIHREKPWVIDVNQPGKFGAKGRRLADRKLVEAILAEDDNSLFDWVRQTYTTGHLLCDDGSMEVADFVHLAPDHTLTLIHAKAAGGKARTAGRTLEVSVSDFEVVTAQAIKNLRHLDGVVLAAKIRGRKARPMDEAIWLNGQSARTRRLAGSQARKIFLNALQARPARSNTQVIILQPRVTESEITYCRKNPRTDRAARLQQLDALMLATEHAMHGRQAKFIAYSAKP